MRNRRGSRGLLARALGAPVLLAAFAVAAGVGSTAAGTASASSPPSPWDGVNPFHCTVQDAKLGATVPHPEADPFCIHFDKTNQNITQGGIATFLLQEPSRTALAVPKCFYFQEDHWRASVVQDDSRTVIYEWIGHYFFDKATGDGGVWVTGFSVNGRTGDPSSLPGFPPGYGQYFGPGTGGFITHDQYPADPSCAAKAKANPAIYASFVQTPRCVGKGGAVRSGGVGPIALGTREDKLRQALGPPKDVERGFLRYCVTGGGGLFAGQAGDRSGTLGSGSRAPTNMVFTTSHRFVLHGRHRRTLTVGGSGRALRSAVPGVRRVARLGGVLVLRAGNAVFELQHGHVRALGVYDRHVIRNTHALLGYLRRAAASL